MRVLIVAEHASLKFGGEAALPLHYYRIFRQRNIPVWLLVHERTRNELEALFPLDGDRLIFLPDTKAHLLLWRITQMLPDRIASLSTGLLLHYLTQIAQRREIRRLLQKQLISIIHQPIPVSPKEPSLIFGMGVPVVIGPMNGGMHYPPAFQDLQTPVERIALAAGRWFANFANWLIPGKRKASMLLVANERTRRALPRGVCTNVHILVENGVDLKLWKTPQSAERNTQGAVRFVFMGRLVDWKAVDLLILAFKRACTLATMSLSIIGSGEEHHRLKQMAQELGILGCEKYQPAMVCFLGWKSQIDCARELSDSDALILPSLAECGGAVVLEAMAMEVPVIATAWGGPVDYLDESCGILIAPSSRDSFIENLARAMVRLATEPNERQKMGKAGRNKVIKDFDWEAKADRMLNHYRSCMQAHQ
jgi:glycosyltransferase involved in cell wall biosynthesis